MHRRHRQQLETTILLRLEQETKPTVLTMTEAGIVGQIGFNSTGLGACLNILKYSLAEVGNISRGLHFLKSINLCQQMLFSDDGI